MFSEIFWVGFLLIASRLFSEYTGRLRIPPVVGVLILGIIIGPSGLRFLKNSHTFEFLSHIGILILMFIAGMETDPKQMLRTGKTSFLVALLGVVIPFIAGILLALLIHVPVSRMFFIATILTATSVSVTVMTLLDMNRLKTPTGYTILGSAVIDDILALGILTFVVSFLDRSVNPGIAFLKVLFYFIFALGAGKYVVPRVLGFFARLKVKEPVLGASLGIMLLYAWIAESLGVAGITGSYIAGLMVGGTIQGRNIKRGVDTIGYGFFIPFFFVQLGLLATFHKLGSDFVFALVFVAIALVSKFTGAFLGGYSGTRNLKTSMQIGIGMMPRGEVALVVSAIGMKAGFLTEADMTATIMLVVVSALITPLLLRPVIGVEE